jgi:hypothetical protein
VKVSTEKLSHEIADKKAMRGLRGQGGRWRARETHMSSNGEMKTSLRLMIWRKERIGKRGKRVEETDVFVLDVLEKFELAIGAFGEDRCAEWLHNLLDSNGCACELVLCRTY